MDAVVLALHELLSIHHLLYLLGGVAVGMVVGVLPGMGGVAGMAMLLPFVYGMEKESALALMIGMLATTATGDTFPSILMGIPGGASSATVLDGFPLARRGEAARALSAAFTSSLLGGVFGSVVLIGCVFVARPLILAIGMGENLLLLIFALSMIGSLTGKSPLKGLAACGIGLLLGSVGSAPATGEVRFTFGTVYLSDGIPLIVLALGVFAIPEIVDLMRQGTTIASVRKLGGGWRDGMIDTFRHWWLVLRVSTIGAVIGILPGLGASTADWLAYGHVVQSARDRSKFGQGDIRGVIAPEAANHAVRGGDLVPTLFFGVPGSGSMALLLGAFILIGIDPGIRMATTELDLTFVIIWSLAIASVIGAIISIILAGPIAKLTLVRYAYLAPLITVLMFFTAYQATQSWGDLLSLLLLCVFGLYLKRFDWPRPALVVGFVLSPGLEAGIYQTAQVYGFSFLERPQALLIVALILLSLGAGILRLVRERRAGPAGSDAEAPSRRAPQLAFSLLLMALLGYALVVAMQTAYLTRLFPAIVAGITFVLILAVAVQQALAPLGSPVLTDHEQTGAEDGRDRPGKLVYLAWFAAFLALVALFGFSIGATLFVVAFISVECGPPLWRSALFGIATLGVLAILSYGLYLEYPRGILADYVALPWWLQ
ncbi:MAG TPA: tripartite tricarboxylate transporter permease [Dongiaceae bacterium]|jgi:TctA family transporter|nr:tripartite tricarboxylate transporter permease [Dongiaceae bacterium]